ncbi:MAG TPA: asparagine synthase-related protein [Steroidobacteraceae bacterium]|nr:asparagine synthase-related protein [Steroidobacteraceae bacterium]
MFRYIGLVWDAADEQQERAALLLQQQVDRTLAGWSRTASGAGLRVYTIGLRNGSMDALLLEQDRGVVLGTLFQQSSVPTKAIQHLALASTDKIVRSSGRSLLREYWGRYVAFVINAGTAQTSVLRDPTGGIPCLVTCMQGVHIYFSSAEDLAALRILTLTVNWPYIQMRVATTMMETRETALNEVTRLVGGECATHSSGKVDHELCWNPFDIARLSPIEDADLAASTLRQAAITCIRSWSSCYTGILHKLSGGLDSSIVLACMQDDPCRPDIVCLNYFSAGSDSDERHYARFAADRARCTLLERERDSRTDLSEVRYLPLTASPTIYVDHLAVNRSELQIARTYQLQAFFDGTGGDQLFFQSEAMLGCADFIHRHGLTRGLLSVALNAAQLENQSIWEILGTSIRAARKKNHAFIAEETYACKTLVTRESLDAARRSESRFQHPWISLSRGAAPGTFWHVASLSFPTEMFNYFARPGDPERLFPLLSQPLIELCLRIPTYLHASNGWDRAIARRAFNDELPIQIARRRSKGGMEEYAKEILLRNQGVAREMLLDGLLVENRVLDRERVAAVLSGQPTKGMGGMAEIFDYVSIEAWVRAWSSPTRHAEAA